MRIATKIVFWGFSLAAFCGAAIPTGVILEPAFGTNGTNRLSRPIGMAELPGRPGSFLVAEQYIGQVSLLSPKGDTAYAKTQFVKIPVKVLAEGSLLGVVAHPQFAANRKYYVIYTPTAGVRRLVVDEREAAADLTKDSGNPPRTVIEIPQQAKNENHNGGGLAFGPDGMLYITVGEGGGLDSVTGLHDPYKNGQNLADWEADILRIDVRPDGNGKGYQVPADNPFVGTANARGEVWAYGFRNPWRINFDALTGDMWVGDVGEQSFEEVSIVRKGENHGWSVAEGTGCYPPWNRGCKLDGITPPLLALPRDSAQCAIGGYVFRGNPASAFYGVYVFADYNSKHIWGLTQKDRKLTELKLLAENVPLMTSLGTDGRGNLYLLGEDGIIRRLSHPQMQAVGTSQVGRHGPVHPGHLPGLVSEGGGWYGLRVIPHSTAGVAVYGLDGRLIFEHMGGVPAQGLRFHAAAGPHVLAMKRQGRWLRSLAMMP